MAIKVNGTTVVDDSRNLTNIASIDATTGAAISAGISTTPPTTYGAVGTYVTAVVTNNNVAVSGGATYSGASLLRHRVSGTYLNSWPLKEFPNLSETTSASLSGTWRLMGPEVRVNFSDVSNYGVAALFVRIS